MALETIRGHSFQKDVATFAADGSLIIQYPKLPKSLTLTSEGTDGGGTLTWLVSNDGATYSGLGLGAAATPLTATVVSATAAGNWVAAAGTAGWEFLKLTLASSTSPTLVVTVFARF